MVQRIIVDANTGRVIQNNGKAIAFSLASAHAIIPYFLNVTISPSSLVIVENGGGQIFTLSADGTNYKLPTPIIVDRTIIQAGSSQTITGKCTVLYTRTNDINGSITFSNVTDKIEFSVIGEVAIPDNTLETADGNIFVTIADEYFITND